MIEHLFVINLIEALQRGHYQAHRYEQTKWKRWAPESPQDGAGKMISPNIQVVSGAETSTGRRQKVTDFRRRLGSDPSAPEMWNKWGARGRVLSGASGGISGAVSAGLLQ